MTRKEYLDSPLENKKDAHRQYYAQFVGPHIISMVKNRFGVTTLKACEDQRYFNDIPLQQWDSLSQALIPVPFGLNTAMREAGDYPTQAGLVCILKEAARQLVERA